MEEWARSMAPTYKTDLVAVAAAVVAKYLICYQLNPTVRSHYVIIF